MQSWKQCGLPVCWKDASEEGECRNVMLKYGLFLLSRDYLVVWATMMGNECFMITIYICKYARTNLVNNKANEGKKVLFYLSL